MWLCAGGAEYDKMNASVDLVRVYAGMGSDLLLDLFCGEFSALRINLQKALDPHVT